MELIIGNEVTNAALKNVFIIEVRMMHGDADGYTSGVIQIPKEKESLAKDAIATLEEMLALPWNGARDAYKKLPGFLTWFGGEYLGDYEDEPWDKKYTYERWDEINGYTFLWNKDYRYRDVYARCDGYNVYFYDEHGTKHHVEVTK